MKIADIKIRKRFRRRLGNIEALAKSIQSVGLLHPPVVLKDGTLVAGRRRIEALKSLGVTETPITVARDLGDALRLAEKEENVCRLNFSPAERRDAAKYLEPILRKEAAARKAAGQKAGGGRRKKDASAKITRKQARTDEQLAEAVGVSSKTLRDEEKVFAAAEQNPELFGPIAEKLDETGNVTQALRSLKEVEHKAALEAVEPVSLPGLHTGDFREKASIVPDASVALVLTDPPYDRKSIALYGDAAKEAARILVDGGSFVCYCGQAILPDVLQACSKHLRYWWTIACLHSGPERMMQKIGVRNAWKPIVWFVKGTRGDVQNVFRDLVTGNREKDIHEWQQSEAEAAAIIEALSPPGGTVVDFFVGGGTIPAAAQKLGRSWTGFEIDPVVAKKAEERLRG